jgi:hypothetical protein
MADIICSWTLDRVQVVKAKMPSIAHVDIECAVEFQFHFIL